MSAITRQYEHPTATIPASDTVSNAISCAGYASGGFRMPSSFTGNSVTFTVSDTTAGTFVPLRNSSNSDVSISVAASKGYPLPAELFGHGAFKIVSSDTEAAERAIGVTLKG